MLRTQKSHAHLPTCTEHGRQNGIMYHIGLCLQNKVKKKIPCLSERVREWERKAKKINIMCLNVYFSYYWDFLCWFFAVVAISISIAVAVATAIHSPIFCWLIEKSLTKFGGMLRFYVFIHKLQSKKSLAF